MYDAADTLRSVCLNYNCLCCAAEPEPESGGEWQDAQAEIARRREALFDDVANDADELRLKVPSQCRVVRSLMK